jgi:hypothetical protein
VGAWGIGEGKRNCVPCSCADDVGARRVQTRCCFCVEEAAAWCCDCGALGEACSLAEHWGEGSGGHYEWIVVMLLQVIGWCKVVGLAKFTSSELGSYLGSELSSLFDVSVECVTCCFKS